MLQHTHPQPVAPQRVVVIGARGFYGSNLVRHLRTLDISVLALTSADLDLTDADAHEKLAGMLKPTDTVVMLAALTPDKGRGMATFMANMAMSRTVCDALELQPVQHVVYISSDAVYPMSQSRITEQTCAQPDDLYGTMHRAREVMFESVANNLAVLRVTMLYGVGDTHNSYGANRFRRMAQSGGPITLFGGGEEKRDHLFIDDAVELLTLVIRHGSNGVLNIATGTAVTFDALARQVASLFTPQSDVLHQERNNPVTYRHFDVTALRKAFPHYRFTPMPDALRQIHDQEGTHNDG
ncbi:NAD-dependent epimerase/dehydratase family protein [Magnetovibrio sp.]|uniref:NAD-dependent epimerase/dehydratase family protein n=1 Tax=Magnetovibrio sp. TaxID=2024836 RepID=UPI002F93BAF8